MTCNIGQNWAATGTVRAPTAGEWANGFTCGPADPTLFNWLFQSITECIQDLDARLDVLEAVGIVTASRGVKATTVLGSPNITTITSTLGDGSRTLMALAVDPDADYFSIWDADVDEIKDITVGAAVASALVGGTGIALTPVGDGTVSIAVSGGGVIPDAATQAEVDAGTVADEYISPLTFKNAAIPATTTFAGRVELLTSAEAATGTDTVRAMTAKAHADYHSGGAGVVIASFDFNGIAASPSITQNGCSVAVNSVTGAITVTGLGASGTTYRVVGGGAVTGQDAGFNTVSQAYVSAVSKTAAGFTINKAGGSMSSVDSLGGGWAVIQ